MGAKERNKQVTMPYLDYNQSNGYLLPPYLEELIPADYVARVVNKVVHLLDIGADLSRQMVNLGLVAIDGTKVKAAASDYGAKVQDSLKKLLKAVEADIERYMAEGLAIDKAEDALYLATTVRQRLTRRKA